VHELDCITCGNMHGATLKIVYSKLKHQTTNEYRDMLFNLTLNLRNMLLKQRHIHCSHMSAVLNNILHDMQHNTENNSRGSTMDIVSSQLIMIKLYVNHLFILSTLHFFIIMFHM